MSKKVKYTTIDWNGHPVKIADWSKLSHKEWEQWRRGLNLIGGSDVSTICGYNNYSDPLIRFYEKIGLKEKKFKPNEMTAGGHADEGGILSRLEAYDGADWVEHFYTDKRFRKVEPYRYTYFSDEMPWLAFNMDGVVMWDKAFPDKGMGVAEFKKIGGRFSDTWQGGMPPYYIPQVVCGMEATGSEYGIIALLKDGLKLIVHMIHRDMKDYRWWADMIHYSCTLFYEAMLKGQALVKAHGGVISDQLLDDLISIEDEYSEILYVSADEKLGSWYSEMHNLREERGIASPDSELVDLVVKREQASAQLNELTEKKNLYDNQIKKWMRDRAAIKAEDASIRVGFRKNLTTKVKDDGLFFGQ